MIPKIIHYCWFGKGQMTEKEIKCIDSWKKFCPDYEIVLWNEDNYDINKNKFISKAYEEKKWAFVTDYARLDIIYNNGGIYFDTDVELIKSPDPLLDNKAFMGFEKGRVIATGLGFGAEKKHPAIKALRDTYNDIEFDINGSENINCPELNSKYLISRGAVMNDQMQVVDDITLYPTEYFCPLHSTSGEMKITKNTYSIHWYSMSWLSETEKKSRRLEQKLSKLFGNNTAHKIVRILYFPYRVNKKLKKLGLKKTIHFALDKIIQH